MPDDKKVTRKVGKAAEAVELEEAPGQYTYVRMTLRSWWDNLPLVLLAGFVFTVISAPALGLFFFALFGPAVIVGALTIVPGWIALSAQLVDVAREVSTNIGVMFKAFIRYWARGVLLGLLAAFPVLAFTLGLPALTQEQVPTFVWLAFAADGLTVLVLLTLYIYAVPLLVIHDMSVRIALRNALILSSRHIMNTLGLLGMIVIFVFATLRIHSALVFLWPAFWSLFVVNNCRMVVSLELEEGCS
jgi:hypothetical protein